MVHGEDSMADQTAGAVPVWCGDSKSKDLRGSVGMDYILGSQKEDKGCCLRHREGEGSVLVAVKLNPQ
jgi:hypothetical protein